MASSSKDPQVPFNGIPEIDLEVMNEMKSIEEKAADVEKHVGMYQWLNNGSIEKSDE